MTAVGRRRRRYDISGASWLGLVVLCLQAWSTPALAESEPSPAAVCVEQAERAQEFYQSGDLAQARAEVALCAQAQCPALVRNDCESWLHEWDEPAPSVKPSATESPPQTRPTSKQLQAPASPPSEPKPERLSAPAQHSPPLWPWIAAAVGVAGGASFAYFGLNGRREAEDLADTCGRNTSCTRAQVDPVREKLVVADISLGVGLIACGAAIWGFATSNNDTQSTTEANGRYPSRGSSLAPVVELRGSSLSARFAF